MWTRNRSSGYDRSIETEEEAAKTNATNDEESSTNSSFSESIAFEERRFLFILVPHKYSHRCEVGLVPALLLRFLRTTSKGTMDHEDSEEEGVEVNHHQQGRRKVKTFSKNYYSFVRMRKYQNIYPIQDDDNRTVDCCKT